MIFADAAASPSGSEIGVFILCAGVVVGLAAAIISIASYFATRREVDDLKGRVDKIESDLDEKTSRIHRRVNRLLAGQMLIAGKMGVVLDKHNDRIEEILAALESEED